MAAASAAAAKKLFIIIIIIILSSLCSCCCIIGVDGSGCKESERRALLAIKAGIYQPPVGNWLSSWTAATDCCTWPGVGCHDEAGHVTRLDLRYPFDYYSDDPYSDDDPPIDPLLLPRPSKLNSSLLGLMHLTHLDLSGNDFYPLPVPEFLGSLVKLEYLNLSYAEFNGLIPPHIGNLSRLRVLDLSYQSFNYPLKVGNRGLHWLSRMISLEYLDMTRVDLSKAVDNWLHDINMLPSLSVLKLSRASLNHVPNTLPFVNLTSLTTLDLSWNNFASTTIPNWLFNITSLLHLDLQGCDFTAEVMLISKVLGRTSSRKLEYLDLSENMIINGDIPEVIGNFTHLIHLGLSKTGITGVIPKTIDKLYNLQHLDLGRNNISGEIPQSLGKLYNLQYLDLSFNNISGEIPQSLGSLCKLEFLDLSRNMIDGEITGLVEELSRCDGGNDLQILYLYSNNLNGTVPTKLGRFFSKLQRLALDENSFADNLTEVHFSNLTNLKVLRLSHNQFTMIFSQDWIPPFNAIGIDMCSCHLGPKFPTWLQTQTKLQALRISEAGISGNIPSWFWDMDIYDFNVSYNQLKGQLPTSLERRYYDSLDLRSNDFDGHIPNLNTTYLYYIDLSNNSFSGSLPLSLARAEGITVLLLSNNRLNGTISPLYFYKMTSLQVLDLSANKLEGILPLFTSNHSDLAIVDLSSNHFSGNIPNSFGYLSNLYSLHLRNNNLTGKIPINLQRCKQLAVLDCGENKLSGGIPTWTREGFPSLKVLRLRSNGFSGNISSQVSHLANIRVLDLAHNNLSGVLPPTFGSFRAMMTTSNVNQANLYDDHTGSLYKENLIITTKGLDLVYTNELSLVISIDLSNNSFYGEIPSELTKLHGLVSLNLSENYLTGEIPESIGVMGQLESLDLSMNNLCGCIPPSLSSLTFLARLNLSHNNLSGRIPSGNQLQSLPDPSIYSGNPALCGWPLTDCHAINPSQDPSNEGGNEGDRSDMMLVYAITAVGFAIGFWSVICTFIIKPSLRIAYFRIIDRCSDYVYEILALKIAKLKSIVAKDEV